MKRRAIGISRLISTPLFKRLDEAGIIDKTALRNLLIREEYSDLRATHPSIESLYILKEKHHLSFDSINTIVFRTGRRKKTQEKT
jgi:hypothetical protein